VPSKVIGYIAAGRQVVASVDGDSDTSRKVFDVEAAIVCSAGDGRALARTIAMLTDTPKKRRWLCENSMRAFEANLAKPKVLSRFE